MSDHLAVAAELAERFAARAAGHDRDARFPEEDVADLRRSGLLGLMAPPSLGGMSGGFEDHVRVAFELTRGNASTALLFNMHSAVVGSLASVTEELAAALGVDGAAMAARDRLLEAAVAGRMFGVAISEPGVGSRLSRLTTSYEEEGDGFRIRGEKATCSGAGHLDGYLVAARRAGGGDVSHFLVPPGDGVTPVGEWDPLGMRATASRGLLLDVRVERSSLLGGVEGLALPLASWMPQWLVAAYASVYAGLAVSAVEAVVAELAPRATESSPQLRARLGRADAEAAATWCSVLEAARAVDREPGSAATNRLVYRAKLLAGDTAMRVASSLAEAVGLSALTRGDPLERILRDARMGSIMPPRSDVAAEVIGGDLLGLDLSSLPW